MSAIVLAAVLAGSACWLLVMPTPAAGSDHSATARPPPAVLMPVVAGIVVVSSALDRRLIMSAVAALLVALAVRRLVRDARRRRDRRASHIAVIEFCDALAAELHAGLPSSQALVLACGDDPRWRAVVSAARLSGDVATSLQTCSEQPGAGGLRAVAAAWAVSERSGAILAEVVERVAASLRDEQDAAAEVVATVAPARATARLLAVLPVFGIGLGTSMGAQPLAFLLRTTAGLACLGLGLALVLAGVFWVERIADRVELS